VNISSALKQHKLFVALCLVVLSVTGGLAHAFNQDPAAPATEEIIDLKSFQTRNGRTLAEVMMGHSLAMLVLVDPNCSACTDAKDKLRALQERVQTTQIAYYVVMIPDGSDPQKFFSFADSLKLDVESFVWSNADVKPASLMLMTKPSHLQVTNEGLIVRKWSGIPEKTGTP